MNKALLEYKMSECGKNITDMCEMLNITDWKTYEGSVNLTEEGYRVAKKKDLKSVGKEMIKVYELASDAKENQYEKERRFYYG